MMSSLLDEGSGLVMFTTQHRCISYCETLLNEGGPMEDCAMAGVSEGIYRTGGPSANENEMNKKCHSGERDLAVSSASSNLVSNLVEGLKKCFYFSDVY